MIEPHDIAKTMAQLEEILAEYRSKVRDLGYDQTRHDTAVDAVHALGYDRHDAIRWLASKPRR